VEPAESILDKGKVAAVTGSGREVGRGITVLMAQQGAKVVVADNGNQVDSSGSRGACVTGRGH
jgi:NAD(P)-dependent dehydrogenase (short-subunit alcohol dehydrogenase family)